jgi:TRAP-type C4-dicarboxylate transport system substrate-binding protein
MIIGDQFWAGLSSEVQAVIKRAAVEAGREERAETIRDGERAQVRLVQEGAIIHKLSAEQRSEAVAKTAVVYDQLSNMFTAGLVDQIKLSK